MNQLLHPDTVAVVPMLLPPGMQNLMLLATWASGIVGVLLFIGFIAAVGKTGLVGAMRGDFHGGTGALICLICAMVLGAATPIFGVFYAVG